MDVYSTVRAYEDVPVYLSSPPELVSMRPIVAAVDIKKKLK